MEVLARPLGVEDTRVGTDRVSVAALRAVVAGGIGLAVVGSAIDLVQGRVEYWVRSYSALLTGFVIGFGVVAWLVIPKQPRNAAVWATATSGLAGVTVLAFAVAPGLAHAEPISVRYPNYVPADHSASVAHLMMVGQITSTLAVFVPLTFGLLLFPDGTLPSPRWRFAGRFAAVSIVAQCVAYAVALQPHRTTVPEDDAALAIAQFLTLVATASGVVAVLRRFRTSTGAARQQCKWVLWGAMVGSVCLVVGILTTGHDDAVLPALWVSAGFAVMIVAYGTALGRYRLYDVDVVITRSIVYGLLAGMITAVYVVCVVGAARLAGDGGGSNTAIAIAVTAALAAVFEPTRLRLVRIVNRLVFGRRVTPHEVLSELSHRVAANDERLLEAVARSLVEGTGAVRAEVWTLIGEGEVKTAEWPVEERTVPGDDTAFTITNEHVPLGSLRLTLGPGQRLSDQDRALAEQVAAAIGLSLKNRVLTTALEQRVVELQWSRRQLVDVQDDTRRRLERDLHDGTQQHLVGLRIKLGLARTLALQEAASCTAEELQRVAADTDAVIDGVRTFARGVHPPLLESEGLGPTLRALARRAPLPVELRIDGIGRYEPQVEMTAHLCVAAALQRAAAADARHAGVTFTEREGLLCIEVRDDGGDVAAEIPTAERSLVDLADRVDALAGTFTVSSMPAMGTTTRVAIPVTEVVT